MISEVFRSLVEGLLWEDLIGGFDLEAFKLLDPRRQLEYARQSLPKIGHGSAREVFDLGGGRVLKVARTDTRTPEWAFLQNKAEVRAHDNQEIRSAFTKLYDFDPDEYSWIIAEKVTPFASDDEFESVFGFSSKQVPGIIKAYHWLKDKEDLDGIIRYTLGDKTPTDAGIQMIEKAFRLTDKNFGDIATFSNWGMSQDNIPVLVDYGVSFA